VFDALRQLRSASQQHRNLPAVRELNRQLDPLLRSALA
jgi:hypothetical protein